MWKKQHDSTLIDIFVLPVTKRKYAQEQWVFVSVFLYVKALMILPHIWLRVCVSMHFSNLYVCHSCLKGRLNVCFARRFSCTSAGRLQLRLYASSIHQTCPSRYFPSGNSAAVSELSERELPNLVMDRLLLTGVAVCSAAMLSPISFFFNIYATFSPS